MKYTKHERLAQANRLLLIISQHGRQFFRNKKDGRIAQFEVDDRGRIWFIDDYKGARIYTHKTGYGHNPWKGFSHGGTLQCLAKALCSWIGNGETLHREFIAPTRSMGGLGDIWGYGTEACAATRAEAFKLPLIWHPETSLGTS